MFLEAISDAIFLTEAATGDILDLNHAACELVGGPRQALIGRNITALHPDEDKARCVQFFEQCRKNTQAKAFCRRQPITLLRADGTRCTCRITILVWNHGGGKVLGCIMQRPATQALIESRLQDSEADFAQALPHTEEGVWSWTPATGEVFLSTRWKEQLGFGPEEFPPTGEACKERLHPQDAPRVLTILRACATGQTPSFSLELRMRHQDGSYRWMLSRGAALRDASGRILRLAGANTDITARKEAEQALRESEHRFRLLAQNTPDAVFLHDMLGNVLDANAQACQLLGYDMATLRGLNVTDFEIICPPEALRDIWGAMQPGPFCFEGLAKRRDGTTFPTEIHGVAFSERGRILALVAARDLTNRKEFERSLAEARDAAMAASRAKSDFLASMSHEIRTPMNIILGMAELLGEIAVAPAQKHYLAAIEESGRMLLHLINDILDLSQIEANKLELRPQAFSPAALIDEVSAHMRASAEEKGLSFGVRLADDLPPVIQNDPQRLRQVLMNLIGNAVKFTVKGDIAIEAVRMPQAEGEGIRVHVTDTGIGIAPEDRDRVFAPFTQAGAPTGRRPAGTGLGLAICKRLTALMGGGIRLESALGTGSTFTVNLPSLPPPPETPAPAGPDAADTPARPLDRSYRLLLAEDSTANQELIKLFLVQEPYEIVIAGTGREALALFSPGAFDLILMDMEMPEMDGCAATEAIRRLEEATGTWRTPVLMLSAHAFSDYEHKGLTAGCDGFMTKPIRKSHLITALRQALARYRPPGPDRN